MDVGHGALLILAFLPVVLAIAFRRHVQRARARAPDGRPRAIVVLVGNTFGLLRTTDRRFERHWQRNAESFRDDVEHGRGATPVGRRRVTFIGDSFTTGHGVADVRDYFPHLSAFYAGDVWARQRLATLSAATRSVTHTPRCRRTGATHGSPTSTCSRRSTGATPTTSSSERSTRA